MRLAGKVAVVTGGGSGIGRGIVLALAREGADIAIPDIQVLNAEKVAGEVKGLGRKVVAMKTDVTSAADVKTMVDRTREAFGKIDILVNNAGAAGPPGMPFTNNTEEDWDRTFTVNTKSVFLTCKAITPHFIERRPDLGTDHAALQRGQDGRDHPDAHRCQGAGAPRRHRERHLSGCALDR